MGLDHNILPHVRFQWSAFPNLHTKDKQSGYRDDRNNHHICSVVHSRAI